MMLVDGKQYQAIWRNLSTGQVYVIDQRHLPHSIKQLGMYSFTHNENVKSNLYDETITES